MEAEVEALRGQVAALEQDLHTARTQLHTLRETETSRSDKMRALMGEAGGALAKDLEELLSLKLGKSQMEAELQEAKDETSSVRAALEAANSIHQEHVATLHTAQANKEATLQTQAQSLHAEADEVRRELEDKSQLLSQALDRAADAEHQLHGLRTRIAQLEGELTKEQQKRRQELDALLADMGQAQREAEEKEKELTSELAHWKKTAEEGDYGTVNRLQEHLEQLRETAEEEVAGLSIKVQSLERERREAVATLESELASQKSAMTGAATKNQTQLQAAEQRTKEKDLSLRRLQKQVPTTDQCLLKAVKMHICKLHL
jgi:predicted  nucleic acid-binding Zn-ribbon protein